MKREKIALFDLDNTISHLRDGWEESLGILGRYLLGDTPWLNEFKAYVSTADGLPSIKHIQKLCEIYKRSTAGSELDPKSTFNVYYASRVATVERRINEFKDTSTSYRLQKFGVPGVEKVLERLKRLGFRIAIVTTSSLLEASRTLEFLGLQSLIYKTYAGLRDKVNFASSPLGDYIILSVKDKRDIVMVGDTPSDIGLAKVLGIKSIGIAHRATVAESTKRANQLYEAGADIVLINYLEFMQAFNTLRGVRTYARPLVTAFRKPLSSLVR